MSGQIRFVPQWCKETTMSTVKIDRRLEHLRARVDELQQLSDALGGEITQSEAELARAVAENQPGTKLQPMRVKVRDLQVERESIQSGIRLLEQDAAGLTEDRKVAAFEEASDR